MVKPWQVKVATVAKKQVIKLNKGDCIFSQDLRGLELTQGMESAVKYVMILEVI